MSGRQRRKIRNNIGEAGSPEDRRRVIEAGVTALDRDVDRIETEKGARRLAFRRKLSSWWTTLVAEDQTPFTIPEDRREAWAYRISALACLALESLLGAAIAVLLMRMPWWVGPIIAIPTALVFDGAFGFGFRHVDRPKETLGHLRRWLLWPSLILFGLSFTLLLLGRAATGDLALWLEPVLTIGLWTTAITLLLLSGVLFAAARVIAWSVRDSAEYSKLDAEQLESILAKEEFTQMLKDQNS